uniref:helix-turn-helix domain-containing protein n=1 Tax=Streptomyces sp. ND04-05B TaxID=3028693 RepID=UPI0039F4B6F2
MVHTVRSLASATGVSYSKIQKLVKEERPTVSKGEADAIARHLQSRRRALFSLDTSPFEYGDERKEGHGPAGANASRQPRRAHQLGEHARPGEQDGEGPSRGERPL